MEIASDGRSGCFNVTDPSIYDRWTSIEISQRRQGFEYFYVLKVDGKGVWSMTSNDAKEHKNVKVFVGDKFYNPVEGTIRHLYIDPSVSGKKCSVSFTIL